jgi:hypothetical protein
LSKTVSALIFTYKMAVLRFYLIVITNSYLCQAKMCSLRQHI